MRNDTIDRAKRLRGIIEIPWPTPARDGRYIRYAVLDGSNTATLYHTLAEAEAKRNDQ